MGCSGKPPDQLLASVKSYLARNETRSAIIELRNALQKDGNSGEARFLLGKAFLSAGDPASATNELRKALELTYSQTLVVPELARSLNAEGQYVRTTAQFETTALTDPLAAADLKTSLAVAYAAEGNGEGRDRALAAALQLVPDFVPALILKARGLAAAGDFKVALQIVDKLVGQPASNPDAWKLKGDLLVFTQSDPAPAIDAYRHALEGKSDLVAAHAGIIEIYLARADLIKARTQLDSLKKAAPNHPQTLYFEARIALQQHDLKTAGQIAQQLLAKAPDDARVLELSGAVDLQAGAFTQAERSLGAALQLAPASASARRLLAEAHLHNGQPALAQATLAPLLDRPDPDVPVLALAAEIASRSGDSAKAESLLTRASQADPGDARTRTALALSQWAQGRTESATTELQGIAGADAGHSADLALVGAALERRDLEGALRAIDGLERKQPGSAMTAALRGRVQLARHDVDAARQSFERALTIEPGYFPAADSLAALDVTSGHPDLARKRFDAMRAHDPHRADVILALAALSESQKGAAGSDATSLYAQAVKAGPNNAAVRLAQIGHLMRKPDVKAALVAAQDAVAVLPDNEALQDALGHVQMASGDLNQALNTFDRQIQQRPNSVAAHLALAEVYAAQNNGAQAAQSLKQALALAPDLPLSQQRTDIASKLHGALLAADQAPDADRFAMAWMRDHPNDAGFASHLGDVALAQGKLPLAASSYKAALEASPDNAAAMNNLAWVMAKLDQPGALALAEEASRLQPKQAAFADTLGAILANAGQFDRAVAAQKRAVDLQPDNVSYRIHLARIYMRSGAKGLAKSELQRLAALGSRSGSQSEVSEMLSAL